MRAGAVDTHDICYEAIPASVGTARTDVVRLARAAGADERQIERLRLAVSEAMSNAVVHAYGKEGGVVRLTATAIAGDLVVVVADDGCGLGVAPKSAGLGLGLGVITQLADGVTLRRRSSGGTQVEMRFAIGDPRERADEGWDLDEPARGLGSLSSMTLPV
jgi:anti-sigma regulatory factor (Ser/Thr protein kinase)